MVGFKIKKSNSAISITVFDTEEVYNQVFSIVNSTEDAIEASSWAELASVGEVYEHEVFAIEVITE